MTVESPYQGWGRGRNGVSDARIRSRENFDNLFYFKILGIV